MTAFKSISELVLKKLEIREPIVVFGMPGNGKLYSINSLINLNDNKSRLQCYIIYNTSEAYELLKYIEIDKVTTDLVIGIFTDYQQEYSWFIEQLNNILTKKNLQVVPIIFTTPSTIYHSLVKRNRLVSRIVLYTKPLLKDEAYEIINIFEKKYSVNLEINLKDRIHLLTGGHIGMIKNLLLEYKLDPNLEFNTEKLMYAESIKGWLYELSADLSKEMLEVLIGTREDEDVKEILIKCGYINEEGKIFSPIFEKYLQTKQQQKFSSINLEEMLTDQEIRVYKLLKDSQSQTISREDIAKAIWREEWLERYSDWAIDQLIHGLRNKMSSYKYPLKIITLRGKGYRLA